MKVILLVLLLAISGNAAAEWVYLSENDSDALYADPSTKRRSGNLTKMWTLADLKSPTGQPYGDKAFKSIKSQMEYDCKKELVQSLAVILHSGNMGGGVAIASDNGLRQWVPVSPGSGQEFEWKFACGKK